MTDEEMDAFVLTGKDLSVPEGGPVHVLTEQDLNDKELLSTRPTTKDTIELPTEIPTFKYKDSLPEQLVGSIVNFGKDMYDYAKSDPANFAYDWTGISLIDVPHDIAEMVGWNTGIKYLPTLRPAVSAIGSIFKPQTYQKKLDAMMANPEDFAE